MAMKDIGTAVRNRIKFAGLAGLAVATAVLGATPLKLAPLPTGKVVLRGEKLPDGNPVGAVSGPGNPKMSWPKLEGAAVTMEFETPVALPQLAVIRYGYDDWAVPKRVAVSLNGGAAKEFALSAPRVAPHLADKTVEADVLELGAAAVTRLEVKVLDVDSKSKQYCGHGILKLAVPAAQQITSAAVSPPAEPGAVYPLKALPAATVKTLDGFELKDPGKIISAKLGDLAVGDLDSLAVRLEFEKPADLTNLALVRIGWSDWATPKTIEVRVNDGPARLIELAAARIEPGSASAIQPADLLALNAANAVNSLEIRVKRIETRANRHGALKLMLAEGSAVPVALSPGDTGHCGLAVEIDVPQTVTGAELRAVAYRFRSDILWSRPLPELKAGTNRIVLDWNEFGCPEDPKSAIVPENVDRLELFIPQPIGGAVMRVTAHGQPHTGAEWTTLEMPDFSPDADGWRSGIPSDGFGRFGWLDHSNGLLTFNLEEDSIFYQTSGAAFGRFRFGNGAPQRTIWKRTSVGSDHVVTEQLKRFIGAQENKVTSRAYGIFDTSRLPEKYVASILAPGLLIHSHEQIFTVHPDAPWGKPWLLLPESGNGIRWAEAADADLTGLPEGWAVVVFEKKPQLPLLIAFDRKPLRSTADGDGVGFSFAGERGWTGIGTPAGYRPWEGKIGERTDATIRLAAVSRKLATLLRNYPLQTAMKFRTTPELVEFSEPVRFLCWRNAWGERGEPVLPCPPLVAFGADQGYPVTFPAGAPEPFGLDTKFGPYRFWPTAKLAAGRYTLPQAPVAATLYPVPVGNADAAAIAEALTGHFDGAGKERQRGDALACWWMYGSAATAQGLLSEEQQRKIIGNWKTAVDFTLGNRPWQVRREPFSGRHYPLSFAWRDGAQQILGDPNSGIGAALSGLESYSRFSGDWRTVAENWEKIRRMPLFFLLSHDWTMMQAGCREHTAASAIDMDVISYEGVAGLVRMARTLGKGDDLAAAEMLLSRYALSGSQKWKAPVWRHPGLERGEWKSIGIGFNELFGFEAMAARGKDPNYINSEVALSYAWIGDFPAFYTMLLKGNGEEFWRFFEYDYVEKQLDNWRKRHHGSRNWHDANIAPHLYMRLLLGEDPASVTGELEAQKMLRPDPRMAAENAGFYALWLGGRAPVALEEWAPARLLRFEWDEQAKTVEADFESAAEFRPVFTLRGEPSAKPAMGKIYPAGKHTLTWSFR